jgi:hypothetical protein
LPVFTPQRHTPIFARPLAPIRSATPKPDHKISTVLVEELHRIPNHQLATVTALAVNGAEAGWHLRLLAHLSVAVPEGFEVFAGNEWQPIA